MSASTNGLRGKRALVAGASSGIGAAMARELAALGVDLVLTVRRQLSTFGVRFLTRRMASKVATQVLGRPHRALPARSLN